VRYVLEGSLRKSGNRIRVTAQLVEAESGKHVWAERYDRGLADIFAVQDDITEAVTIAVAPAIADAERHRAMRKLPGSLDAWAAYQRSLWHLSKFTAEDNQVAQKFSQQAIDLDPAFAGPHRGLAEAQFYAAVVFRTRSLSEVQSSMEGLARRAVALDGGDAEAHSWLGVTLLSLSDYEGALAEAERAIALSPNLAIAHGWLGHVLIWSGRPKDGLAEVQRYRRLDPRDPSMAILWMQETVAHYFCCEYEAAAQVAKGVIRSYPDFPLPYRWLAAALGQAGRIDEANQAFQTAATVSPASFEIYVRARPAWFRAEDHAHMLEGLRKAGWHE
jgi:adenylate cyclase